MTFGHCQMGEEKLRRVLFANTCISRASMRSELRLLFQCSVKNCQKREQFHLNTYIWPAMKLEKGLVRG